MSEPKKTITLPFSPEDVRRGASVATKVQGVGRIADNPRALLVILSAEPSDDDLRSMHDFLREWRPTR